MNVHFWIFVQQFTEIAAAIPTDKASSVVPEGGAAAIADDNDEEEDDVDEDSE